MDGPSQLGPLPWLPGATPPPVSTLPELADYQAERLGDAEAIIAGNRRLTYRQFAEEIQSTAAGLAALGVKRGSHVGLLAPNTADWLVVSFAVMRLGAVLESFNTWVKAYDLRHLIGSSNIEMLMTVPGVRSTDLLAELQQLAPDLWGAGHSAEFPRLRHIVLLDGDVQATQPPASSIAYADLDRSGDVPHIEAQAGDTAYVVYTSGTTLQPKAVPLVQRALIENGFAIGSRMGLTSADRVWLGSPLFWSYGCANAAMAVLGHGSCLVLQERFIPQTVVELMAAERVTAAYLLPSIVLALAEEVREEIRAIASLRTGLTIGTPEEVSLAVLDLDIPELCNVYGSTETYGNCCVTDHRMPLEQRIACQGEPLPGVELRVVTDDGTVAPRGELGEFQVRGRVMAGYIGDPEATAEVMTADGWFRTGDTGIIRREGTVQFGGRATDMIKTSGINVSPAEVEGFLSRHPAVLEVGVVGAPHPSKGEVTIAFVVLRAGETATSSELIAYCKQALAGFKVPWAIDLVNELPRTTTGKLMRNDLRAPAADLVVSLTAKTGERA